MLLSGRGRGLRTRIIAWSFIPTAIILLAVALVTFYAYQRVTEDLVMGRNRELTRLSAGQLATDLGEYTVILGSLARVADVYKGDPTAQQAALSESRNRLVVFDGGVVILDGRGRVAASEPARPEILDQDWSGRAYYRQMLRSARPVFSDVVPDGPRGTDVIVVAVPITGEQGEFRGTLAGMFQLGASSVSSFYGGIVKLRIGEGATAYLVDGQGRVIYHSDAGRIGENVAAQPMVQQVLRGKVGDLRTRDLDGQDVVATFAPVPGTGWGLVVQEAWAGLIASSGAYQQFLLLLLALGVVVPVVVVAIGVRRITRPIEELIAAAREVAQGKLGRTIDIRTGDELEELAKQFNLMSAQLQESYAHLEQRVADRTRELATLHAIAAVVSRSLDIEEILHDALDKTLEITAIEAGAAFRTDQKSRMLTLVAYRGLPEDVVRYVSSLPLEASSVGRAAQARQPIAIQVAELPDRGLQKVLTKAGLRFVVSVPLMAKGRPLGAINLATRTERPMQAEELSLLAGIGHQIGVALENAELYEKAEESAAAAERSRLARDLHDAVTQTLFSASLIAEVLPRIWDRNPEEGRRRLDELRQLTRGALAEMRALLLELRPTQLTDAGLGDLLRQLAEATTGRARLPVALQVEGQYSPPPEVKLACYRIAQEALNNVAKHAAASKVELRLCLAPGRVELAVRDDGRGFDRERVSPEHLGLGIMAERAEGIGAALRVTTEPGHGTEVVVVWQEEPGREMA